MKHHGNNHAAWIPLPGFEGESHKVEDCRKENEDLMSLLEKTTDEQRYCDIA
jgi:hypothetical protein